MDKQEFLSELRRRLAWLPASETEGPIAFYAEGIDDRVEDGMSEREAVAALGGLEEIVREIERTIPVGTLVRERVRSSREGRGGLWTLLVVLGFPLWLPLLIAAGAVALSVYIVLWAVIVSLYAVLFALAVTGLTLLVYGLVRCFQLGLYPSLMVFGLGFFSLGLGILLFRPCTLLVKALLRLTKRFGPWLKGLIGKGGRKA